MSSSSGHTETQKMSSLIRPLMVSFNFNQKLLSLSHIKDGVHSVVDRDLMVFGDVLHSMSLQIDGLALCFN